MVDWADENPPPANILLLSAVHFFYPLQTLRDMGYNVLPQVFYDYSQTTPATSTQIESLWKKFYGRFLKDSEKECSETSECEWTCRVCVNDPINYTDFTAGQGFENFTNHLLSQEHHQNVLDYLTPDLHHSYKEKAKAYRDSHPKNATTSVNNEPKMLDFLTPDLHQSYEEKAKAYTTSVNKEPKRKCKKQKTSRR